MSSSGGSFKARFHDSLLSVFHIHEVFPVSGSLSKHAAKNQVHARPHVATSSIPSLVYQGVRVMPAAALIEFALAAVLRVQKPENGSSSTNTVELKDFYMSHKFDLDGDETYEITCEASGRMLEFSDAGDRPYHGAASCSYSMLESNHTLGAFSSLAILRQEITSEIQIENFRHIYPWWHAKRMWSREGGNEFLCYSETKCSTGVDTTMYHVHPFLLDASFVAVIFRCYQRFAALWHSARRILLLSTTAHHESPSNDKLVVLSVWAHVKFKIVDPEFIEADVVVYDGAQPTLLVEGFRTARAKSPSPAATWGEINWVQEPDQIQKVAQQPSGLASSAVSVLVLPGFLVPDRINLGLESLSGTTPQFLRSLQDATTS